MACEDLLSQCQFALVAALGATITALVAFVKSHSAEKYVRNNLLEKEERNKE